MIGYSIEEAERLLGEAGLKLGEQIEVIDDEYPKGYVVWQEYAKDYNLKIDAEVDVRISKGQKTVLVPDVTEYTRTDMARATITSAGLLYEEKIEFSNTVEEGVIIRQEPMVNEEVEEGSVVTVYISGGPDSEGLITVPNLIGKTEKEASALLDELKLIPVVKYESKNSLENGVVINQLPEEGNVQSELTEVTIVVNKLLGEEPKEENPNKQEPSNPVAGKKSIGIDLSSRGERDTFVVKVVLEGQTVGRKVEYEANHKRSDGVINVLVTDISGAMLKVYIDDKVVSEMVLP